MLLYGARRINRFERQIFLTTVALQGEGDVKRDLIAGKHTALLALFSNPTVPPKLRKALRLEPSRRTPTAPGLVVLDGEVVPFGPIEARAHPGALRVLLP